MNARWWFHIGINEQPRHRMRSSFADAIAKATVAIKEFGKAFR